jgi:hypothetical protein
MPTVTHSCDEEEPTHRTDKESSSITDNMITFNGISVYSILNFKFKQYSL